MGTEGLWNAQCQVQMILQLFKQPVLVSGEANRVTTVWNSLPDTVVKAESVNTFKNNNNNNNNNNNKFY